MPEGGGFRTRLTGPVLGMLAVVFVVILAFTTSLYRQIELKTLDWRFGARPALQQSELLLHVDIDDKSIASWGRWPWSRDRHVTLLRILEELGAEAVVFDIEFTEPSNPEDDNAFARALRETGFSFLPCRLDLHPEFSADESALRRRIQQRLSENFEADELDLSAELKVPLKSVRDILPGLKRARARSVGWAMLQAGEALTPEKLFARLLPEDNPYVDCEDERRAAASAADYCLARREVYQKSAKPLSEEDERSLFSPGDVLEPPIYLLTRSSVGLGAPNTKPDIEDGVLRHVSLFFVEGDRLIPHLAFVAACRAVGSGLEEVEITPGRHVTIHPKSDAVSTMQPIVIPVDDQCRIIVNWAATRQTSWDKYFTHVPYGSFLSLHKIREAIACNAKQLTTVYGEVDKSFGGKWSAAHTKIRALETRKDLSEEERKTLLELKDERQKHENQMYDFLKRKTQFTREDIAGLPETVRKDLETMKHCRDVIERQNSAIANEEDLRRTLKKLVQGRMCIVGSTETASTDLKPTPIRSVFPGVGVHSAVINSILQRRFIGEAPTWVNVLVIIGVGLLVSVLASFLSTRWAAVGTLAGLVGWSGVAYVAFILWGWWVTMAGPVLAGFLSYAAITAYRQLTEERQKRHIRNAFHHYLSPAVVEEVLQNPEALKLGGERKELTVLFSDVAGFTPISEQMEAEELVLLLNDYLSEMSDVILDSKGYINKYVGDGIMAVFGAPLDDPENAAAACRVALESQHRLKDFRAKLTLEKRPIIRARIGINSGIMIVGNMGSRTLFDYTVMGDNVNIGARLENANKHFGTEIIIGENTYAAVRDTFEARRLGLVHVKGRSKPVGAYELLGEKGKCPPLVRKLLPHYEEGLAAYSEQRWDTAIAAFAESLKINAKDGPSRAYLERCQQLAEHTGVEHWDGTFTLETK